MGHSQEDQATFLVLDQLEKIRREESQKRTEVIEVLSDVRADCADCVNGFCDRT